jgi:paraquat-inducible protein A
MSDELPRAHQLGLVGCEACGLVMERHPEHGAHPHDHGPHCPRCDEEVHERKPNSIARCWAYLIAAAVLYIPANVLPIMRTQRLRDDHVDTILSGVVYLWKVGSYDLAIIVFTASIVVPLVKIGTLALLLVTTQRQSTWRQRDRATLFRGIEFVGHWSMLDVFVVAILITLVQFGSVAQIHAGAGIVAFGAVVVLTMLASMSFDPRLIWDEPAVMEEAGGALRA